MKRILIVEDDLDIQELLDAYLRDAGYDTVLALSLIHIYRYYTTSPACVKVGLFVLKLR